MWLKFLCCIILGYSFGSLVAALLISRVVFKDDIRLHGSGNSGATNAARVYGLPFGILTFVLDFLKGVAACALGRAIGGAAGMACAGFFCVLGHCFPLFFRMRGGKGVSVGAAFALMMDWRILVAALTAFIIIAAITRIVSLSSIVATVTVGVMSALMPLPGALRFFGPAAAVLVLIMHHNNIKRLFNGTEKQMTFGGR